jgi:cellulose synthase/poly-beta-1,6-N-acetylglucosamine synthase-like glycosyltransferase
VSNAAAAIAWFFVAYVLAANVIAIALNLLAIPALYRRRLRPFENLPQPYAGFEPPVSLIVPAGDGDVNVPDTVRALLRLEYPAFEVVVVNDAPEGGTLAALRHAFDLEPFPEAYWRRLKAGPVRAVYHSRTVSNLRVFDKDHGGRADALNAGINASRYPLFCVFDGSSVPLPDSLRRVVEPFLENADTVAAVGSVRLAQPRRLLALLQVVESLRGTLFARPGWATLGAALHASGFVVLRKDSVVEAGGYRTDAVDAELEVLVRVHRMLRLRRERYAVRFVPDATSWKTGVAETLEHLREDRRRAQHALADSVHLNRGLVNPRGGVPGLVALPLVIALECFGPFVELAGYAAMALLFAVGAIPGAGLLAYVLLALSMGLLASLSALMLEEASFGLHPRWRLVAAAFVDNLGYRQLVAGWRVAGLARWMRSLNIAVQSR